MILENTIKDLRKIDDLSKYFIKQIFLRSDFSVVSLNDDAIGSCLNYANAYNKQLNYEPKQYEGLLLEKIKSENDPLLFEYLNKSNKLRDISVLNSVISALSQKFFNNEFLNKYNINCFKINGFHEVSEILDEKIQNNIKVSIIGFEGLTSFFLQNKFVDELTLIDYNFSPQRGKFHHKTMASFNKLSSEQNNKARIKINDGQDIENDLKNSDWVIISGSSLANNTLERILSLAKGKEVVLQGPSCSILPFQLFKMGVNHIFTTKKNKMELRLGQLEGGAINKVVDKDYIYLTKLNGEN